MSLDRIPVVYLLLISTTFRTCGIITLTGKVVSWNSNYFIALCASKVVVLSRHKSVMTCGFRVYLIPTVTSVNSECCHNIIRANVCNSRRKITKSLRFMIWLFFCFDMICSSCHINEMWFMLLVSSGSHCQSVMAACCFFWNVFLRCISMCCYLMWNFFQKKYEKKYCVSERMLYLCGVIQHYYTIKRDRNSLKIA